MCQHILLNCAVQNIIKEFNQNWRKSEASKKLFWLVPLFCFLGKINRSLNLKKIILEINFFSSNLYSGLGFVFFPFIINDIQDIQHSCPECNFKIGMYKPLKFWNFFVKLNTYMYLIILYFQTVLWNKINYSCNSNLHLKL